MANHSKDKKDKKEIRVPMLVSENDIEAHGGMESLRNNLRYTRDLNYEELQNITNKALKKLQDDNLESNYLQQLKK